MNYPMMQTNLPPSREQVIEFKGYDVRSVIEPGSMRGMKNLSTDEYPNLYQRPQRGIYSGKYKDPDAILTRKEKLAVCDSTSFWYDGKRIFNFRKDAPNGRQMQAINSRIVIWPDKMYYNTETNEYGSLEASVDAVKVAFHKDPVTYETCATFTFDPGRSLKEFNKGDAISFRGMSTLIKGWETGQDNNIDNGIIENIDYDNNRIYFAYGVINYPTQGEEDFEDTGESGYGFNISRNVPDLDFVLEYNNRLYGTHENTIYASKLGDPMNWYSYGTGTAEASYSLEVGSDGEFTGIAPYSDHIVFFKENCMHKLYGYKPSNYQMLTTQCLGLEKGSHKSVKLISGYLFYKSREGIMVYTGSAPTLITQNFGRVRYDSAAAGTDMIKYYVSMRNKTDGKYYLFVYDVEKRLWLLEDNTHASDFAFIDNRLVYCDKDSGDIKSVIGEGEDAETDPIEWYALFGEYDEYSENKKVYSKIQMRLKMEENSTLGVWISIDGGVWESIYRLDTHTKRTVEMPIVPRRCDKFAILLTGKGYTKIESMVRCVREGTAR